MTRMIYIPPFALLSDTLHEHKNYRHLMLPHLLYHERYMHFFMKVKHLGQYIILDNGAAEGAEVAWSRLASTAHDYRVDELVLPDQMGNPEATLEMAKDFLSDTKNTLPKKTRLGYVLHGNNARDAKASYDRLTKAVSFFNRIEVIYLPRILVTAKEPRARIEVAQYIMNDTSKPMHFLGASPHRLDEGKWIRDELRGAIRSMDTSAPFVYAMKYAYVNDGSKRGRDIDTYFDTPIDPHMRDIAKRNCEIMDGWIGAQASASQV